MIDRSRAPQWSAEDRVLLACTRLNFGEEQLREVAALSRAAPIDWDQVYTTADVHGVAPLVFTNLQLSAAEQIPRPIVEQFERALFHNVLAKSLIANKTGEVLAYFGRLGIDVMLIKGAALDRVLYEHPWYTVANDVDLILNCHADQVDARAIEKYIFTFDNIHFEYDYVGHHDVSMNGSLPIDFGAIWSDAQPIDLAGQRILVMAKEDLLIASCINSCRKRFYRLKNLLDIAEMVNAWSGTTDWNRFVSKCKAYQCSNIVFTALLVARSVLGCKLPESIFDALDVHPARAQVIRYVSGHSRPSRLADLRRGLKVLGRPLGASLVLPYAAYDWRQLGRKLLTAWC